MVICLVMMFTLKVTVIKMLKMAQVLYYADDSVFRKRYMVNKLCRYRSWDVKGRNIIKKPGSQQKNTEILYFQGFSSY